MADRLDLEARFNDKASAGVKRLGKALESVKPSNGMEAATKWMQGFRKEADNAFKASRNMPEVLSAVGIGGLAASMSLGALAKSLKSAADGALDLRELGRESGMAAVEIQRLQYAADKLHVDPSKVTGAIKSWSSQMLQFRTTRSEFYRYLQTNNNGDIAKKIAADSPEQGFEDTLDYLARIPDAAMKAGRSLADAMQIQKQVAEMAGVGDLVPMLAKGPEGIRDAMGEAALKVKPLTQEMIDAAERMNASVTGFNQSWTNLVNSIGPSLINPMTDAIDKLDAVFKEGEKVFSRGAPEMPPPTKPGEEGESTTERLGRTFRNSLRVFFKNGIDDPTFRNSLGALFGGGGLGEDANLLGGLFGPGKAHADELRPGMRPSASNKWAAPSRYATEALARGHAYRGVTNTDGNALRRGDEMPVGALRAADLFATVRQGSKEGIVAGLREMAQQQELGDGGAGGGSGGTLGAANRLLNWAGRAVGARPRAGGGFTAAMGGGTTPAKGALAANQKIAYAQFLKDGWSPTAAHAMVANDSGESLAGPSNYHWDRLHMSGGIVQWDPQRAEAIKRQFGDYPWKLSVADQARAQSWEIRNNPRFAATLRALQGDNGAEMIGALVDNYESPAARAKAKAERMGFYRGFHPDAQATPGAGTPAPSSAAVSDADVFKARQRIINGSRDPADRALVDRYKREQNTPQGHRAGGWISGPGTGTSDSIPAMLSHGEFVVRAGAAKRWGALLHAINGDRLPRYADGGGVGRQFYPSSTPGISADEGRTNRRSWLDFFRRPRSAGGMGAPWHVALGATAMMNGETGWGLNGKAYGWDVNGPSGGSAQWHDVTTGRGAGRLHRLSDLMRMAMEQHADWHERPIQQAWWKHEALGGLNWAWQKMLAAKTARAALDAGVRRFEVPAHQDQEVLRRLPNIVRLAREAGSGGTGGTVQHAMDPLDVTIRHHPHTGHPIVQARAGRGVRLNLRTGPTMRPT